MTKAVAASLRSMERSRERRSPALRASIACTAAAGVESEEGIGSLKRWTAVAAGDAAVSEEGFGNGCIVPGRGVERLMGMGVPKVESAAQQRRGGRPAAGSRPRAGRAAAPSHCT